MSSVVSCVTTRVCLVVYMCVFYQACRCIAVLWLCVLLLLSWALCAEFPVTSVVSDHNSALNPPLGWFPRHSKNGDKDQWCVRVFTFLNSNWVSPLSSENQFEMMSRSSVFQLKPCTVKSKVTFSFPSSFSTSPPQLHTKHTFSIFFFLLLTHLPYHALLVSIVFQFPLFSKLGWSLYWGVPSLSVSSSLFIDWTYCSCSLAPSRPSCPSAWHVPSAAPAGGVLLACTYVLLFVLLHVCVGTY